MKLKLGRWIWCKYCQAGLYGKNVKPELGGIYQIICSECGSGLTPDFFSKEGLMEYLKSGDYNKASNIKEEKIASKEILKAMEEGKSRESIYNTGRGMIVMHTSQPELRQISEETIKIKS